MDNHGFIHERLDLKILILYILSMLSHEVDVNILYDLCLCDGGVEYFEFTECMSELTEYGQLVQSPKGVIITEKGRRNVEAVSSSLPHSVRVKAAAAAKPVNADLVRKSLISASHTVEQDGCYVNLALSDGVGEIMNLSFLCSGEEQAGQIEEKFNNKAEDYYNKIVNLFTEG